MQEVIFRDLGKMGYQEAWDHQEVLLQENVRIKTEARRLAEGSVGEGGKTGAIAKDEAVDIGGDLQDGTTNHNPQTTNYLLFVEHPPVYTLGKSGHMENILIDEAKMQSEGIAFFRTNRGGDITFHGPGQIVGYPILDLEKFYTDIGRYLRDLEQAVILLLADYGIRGERSPGETGVWIEPGVQGRERKICAIGVRCSRWITMHGLALNVNTDLGYFGNIIPCGIQDKQVSSLERELGHPVDMGAAKEGLKRHFATVFGARLIGTGSPAREPQQAAAGSVST